MIGERLKELRLKAGLTQIELAEYVNVSQGAIGNWEADNRDPDYATLTRLADYFHVTTDYLLGRDAAVSAENGQKEKAPAGEPAEAPSRDQMIEDIIRIYRQMSDAEKLDFLARLNAPKEP